MVSKREIRVTHWENRRDRIVYDIHWYSDGTRWYENLGKLDSKGKRRSRSGFESGKTTGSTRKGQEFEDSVARLVKKAIIGEYLIRRRELVLGTAGPWEADIIVSEPGDFAKSGILGREKAVVECKYSGQHTAPGSYVTGLARGYMHLNDIRLANQNVRLFLVVNRLPKKGENPRDSKVLFDKIGVNFINLEDEEGKKGFIEELTRLR